MLKSITSIVSRLLLPLAAPIACLSDPSPLSLVLVTLKVAAYAGGGDIPSDSTKTAHISSASITSLFVTLLPQASAPNPRLSPTAAVA